MNERQWMERQRLRLMREEVEEGSRHMAEAILEGSPPTFHIPIPVHGS